MKWFWAEDAAHVLKLHVRPESCSTDTVHSWGLAWVHRKLWEVKLHIICYCALKYLKCQNCIWNWLAQWEKWLFIIYTCEGIVANTEFSNTILTSVWLLWILKCPLIWLHLHFQKVKNVIYYTVWQCTCIGNLCISHVIHTWVWLYTIG
jgi:hypothetical protein